MTSHTATSSRPFLEQALKSSSGAAINSKHWKHGKDCATVNTEGDFKNKENAFAYFLQCKLPFEGKAIRGILGGFP